MEHFLMILIPLLLSAFFSGMEIAFTSSNKLMATIDNADRSITSRILSVFYKNSGQYISTMLVGNNIVLVIYSIAFVDMIEPAISRLTSSTLILSLIQTVVATTIVIFIGEFIPKVIFKNNSNFLLRLLAPIMMLFYSILYPISKFATLMSVGMLKLFGAKIKFKSHQNAFNKTDLSYLVDETIEQSNSQKLENEIKIFKNALDFSSVKLRECIVPRNEITALDIETSSIEDLRNTFADSGFSKILIYKDSIDNIIGYIHSSDLFEKTDNWKTMLRKIPVVPESMPANKLMPILLKEKKSIAVVIDEFGGTGGIVTLEDIVEEIFGEIEDEHDVNEYILKKTEDGDFLISGRLEIDTINNKLDINLPESEEYVTLAGLILSHHKKIPNPNDIVDIKNWSFKVIEASKNRIGLVKMSVK